MESECHTLYHRTAVSSWNLDPLPPTVHQFHLRAAHRLYTVSRLTFHADLPSHEEDGDSAGQENTPKE